VQDSSESVGGDLFQTEEDCSRESYSSQVDNRGNDGTGCFRIKIRTDAMEFTDMIIAGLRT